MIKYKYKDFVKENITMKKSIIMNQGYDTQLEKVLTYIESNLNDNLCIEELSSICGYSRFHFQRIFKEYVGENICVYINRLRIERSAFMLKYQYKKISSVGMRVGYNSNTSFTRAFKQYYHLSPTDFRESILNYSCFDIETPSYEIVHIEDKKVFFIRTRGDYEIYEEYAWDLFKKNYENNIYYENQYISICYDEPTIVKEHSSLRYEACALYDEQKHKNLDNLHFKTIKGGKYAKFCFEGTLKELDAFFYKIYYSFFHNKEYQIKFTPAFQVHHNHVDNLLHGSTKTDFYFPID
ncbi:MAG: AraC family transcriptional regulator [Sulfurimonas sp.]|jgi:AraC family transcriptional regulator